jgi:hypothetical protein
LRSNEEGAVASESVPPDKPDALAHFRSWFWQRPLAHGEVEAERTVFRSE